MCVLKNTHARADQHTGLRDSEIKLQYVARAAGWQPMRAHSKQFAMSVWTALHTQGIALSVRHLKRPLSCMQPDSAGHADSCAASGASCRHATAFAVSSHF